jgi:hypothetical protein
MRGMSTSHHREVIDNHMNDSNWKKLIGLCRLLLTGAASELIEIMQSMSYLNAIAEGFLGQYSVQ